MANVNKILRIASVFHKCAQVEGDAQKIAVAEAAIYKTLGLRTESGRDTMGVAFSNTLNDWVSDVWESPLKTGDTISVEMSASPGAVKIWPTINKAQGPDPKNRFIGAGMSQTATTAVQGLEFPNFTRTLSSPTKVG